MPTPLQLTQVTTSFLGNAVPPDGSLTPEQIVNAMGKWPKGHCRATCLDAATTGNIPAYNSPLCSGTVRGNTQNIAGALEQKAIDTGLNAIPVVGSTLASFKNLILGFIGAHHKAAVKNEQTILCQAVPWATQLLQGVDELFLTGQIDAPTAAGALDNGLQQFLAMVKPIYQDSGNSLNAAGCYARYLKAAILFRKNNYGAAVALNTRGANDVFNTSASSSIPAGSSGQFVSARDGWNVPAKAVAPKVMTQSLLGAAGVDSSKLVLAVIVLIVLGFGVAVNASIFRRVK